MNDGFRSALLDLVERVLDAATHDHGLRSSLRACAEQILAITGQSEVTEQGTCRPGRTDSSEVAGQDAGGLETPVFESPSPSGRGMEASAQDAGPGGDAPASTTEREGADPSDEDALTHAEPTRPTAADGIEDDLPGMKERLLLKAESAAWAASRWRRLDEHADYRLEIVPQDQEFFQKGKAVGCYLWMLTTRVPRPSSPDDYELIAACFENLAEAVALVQHVGIQAGWNPEPLKPCLTLLAKAQSALRGAVAACGGYADADQAEVFTWLRAFTQEKEVFIEQGMRSDNLADPTEWASLAGELHALQVEFDAQLRGRRRKKKLLAKLKHKASVVSSSPPDRKREAWQDVMTVVDNLVEAGVQPSRA